MYENQLLDAMTRVATTLDAIRCELDALVGLLDFRLRPPGPAELAEVPVAADLTGDPPRGRPGAEEVA